MSFFSGSPLSHNKSCGGGNRDLPVLWALPEVCAGNRHCQGGRRTRTLVPVPRRRDRHPVVKEVDKSWRCKEGFGTKKCLPLHWRVNGDKNPLRRLESSFLRGFPFLLSIYLIKIPLFYLNYRGDAHPPGSSLAGDGSPSWERTSRVRLSAFLL